jgi:hypothetical protein
VNFIWKVTKSKNKRLLSNRYLNADFFYFFQFLLDLLDVDLVVLVEVNSFDGWHLIPGLFLADHNDEVIK